ncbi:MAG: TdeIII family type II restriction endonuclease [Termitinemataceae bacterium]|nr:MAG: TdeIII family type II restriction endonuclease [Termitinemataceae bacterium]
MNNTVKERISIEVIKTLFSRFNNFPTDSSHNRNAPFHEAFLKAFSDKFAGKVSSTPFLISLSSWLHGLNTTLGQSFFENVAHVLCGGKKLEYTSKKTGNLKITKQQQDRITQIMTSLSNSSKIPDLEYENGLIFVKDDTPMRIAPDFSADVFRVNEKEIIAVEIKTVKPNSGGLLGEKQKILEGKAALFHEFPGKKISFFFGFPFDPTVNIKTESVTSFNKKRFLNSIVNAHKFVSPEEVLVASEFWDFLSGEKNTMEEILSIINTIATPAFMEKLRFIDDDSKRNTLEYTAQLQEWNLFSEHILVKKDRMVLKNLNKETKKVYDTAIFDNEGNYNWWRFSVLEKLLRE